MEAVGLVGLEKSILKFSRRGPYNLNRVLVTWFLWRKLEGIYHINNARIQECSSGGGGGGGSRSV